MGSGSVTLPAGMHDVLLEFFQKGGGSGMIFQYQGPDTEGRTLVVPSTVLWQGEVGSTTTTPGPTPMPTPAPTMPHHYFAASTAQSTCESEGGAPTTKDMCSQACDSGVGGATRYKIGSWDHSPGCFAVVSGPWQGGCHWNLNTEASAYMSRTRAVSTTMNTTTTTTQVTPTTTTTTSTTRVPVNFSPLPASHRCMGQPPHGWANLGTGLTQGQCHDRCLPIQSCNFVTFWSASGACTSFEGCDSTVTQTWNKVSGLERRLRGAVQTWAKVLGEEDQGILI